MTFLYNFITHLTYFFLRIYAVFNKKMKLFVSGRAETFHHLSSIKKEDRTIWFHVASLGEFEQAIPIIESTKESWQDHKIIVTFFSPSGYEIRKNSKLADVICYLPFDTKSNMKRFVELVHPEIAIIVKYEFWPNLLRQLKKQSIPTILVSGIFRKNQIFFKSTGQWMRKSLTAFHHIFVQDSSSMDLLESINFSTISITGDTRFDRVSKILDQDNTLPFMSEFKNNQYTVVAGSTWNEGEDFLVNYINNSKDEKFIIAPHTINSNSILKLKESLKKETILYSEKEGKNLSEYTVLIIDTIGLLTKIYSYADTAYVGGGFRTGLHNILEPATFGIPIVIGSEYYKFKEAIDLVSLKGCISVQNQSTFSSTFRMLKNDLNYRKEMGKVNKTYIKKNIGATAQIMHYINNQISS
ncbi:3-deoxy-D-manno-octulosonic acid transferase [Flavobacteriaceae bacterium]|nr:3-deoxy-D-manno-octulosonic acid transferase [Flavobacteriaceae bacterium]